MTARSKVLIAGGGVAGTRGAADVPRPGRGPRRARADRAGVALLVSAARRRRAVRARRGGSRSTWHESQTTCRPSSGSTSSWAWHGRANRRHRERRRNLVRALLDLRGDPRPTLPGVLDLPGPPPTPSGSAPCSASSTSEGPLRRRDAPDRRLLVVAGVRAGAADRPVLRVGGKPDRRRAVARNSGRRAASAVRRGSAGRGQATPRRGIRSSCTPGCMPWTSAIGCFDSSRRVRSRLIAYLAAPAVWAADRRNPQTRDGFVPVDQFDVRARLLGRVRGRRHHHVPGQAGRDRDAAGRRGRRGDRCRCRRRCRSAPFSPVLRGLLLTGAEPRYLRRDAGKRSRASSPSIPSGGRRRRSWAGGLRRSSPSARAHAKSPGGGHLGGDPCRGPPRTDVRGLRAARGAHVRGRGEPERGRCPPSSSPSPPRTRSASSPRSCVTTRRVPRSSSTSAGSSASSRHATSCGRSLHASTRARREHASP